MQTQRPSPGDAVRRYRATGEIPKQPQETTTTSAKGTALLPSSAATLPTDRRGRAYLAINLAQNETIFEAIESGIAHFLDMQHCNPTRIELRYKLYEKFHYRCYYPDASANGILIVPAMHDKSDVLCLGEERRH